MTRPARSVRRLGMSTTLSRASRLEPRCRRINRNRDAEELGGVEARDPVLLRVCEPGAAQHIVQRRLTGSAEAMREVDGHHQAVGYVALHDLSDRLLLVSVD